ncbi:hypothetical protein AAFC00_006508 [Neodothiora populina]|uniref:Major facilitator superfamily (MFS) profile domain-containing protein n=1 Tax=Neodothiora populina TaxID=2781224 RepID=A0ABR3PA62_9PEZI
MAVMGPSFERHPSSSDLTYTPEDKKSTIDDEKTASPSAPSPPIHTDVESCPLNTDITYPEGGRDAWLVVLGAWCGLTASIGIYNSSGVFEVVMSQIVLPDESPTSLGWIFSVYAFVTWICGVQIGPTFDAMGPRALLIAGTVCTLVGIFTLSICKEYYQIILSFSILTGLGSSLLVTPSMACVAHWFMERRGLASGVAWIGGGFGGILFPLMIQSLLPQVGWAWSIRILGFVLLVLCAISVAFCRSRIPPRKGAKTTWRDTLPDPGVFMDGTGAMAATTAGVLFVDLAYFIPVTYVPSYYMDRQGLSKDQTFAGSAAFAYQLLAILNAASCLGRFVAGHLADRFGRYNTMIISLFLCMLSVFCFWLPDILSPNMGNNALLIIFVILFGFVSGSNVSLTPICLGQLCQTQDYGRYYASCYTVVAFGVLVSISVAGSILDAVDAIGRRRYWGVALFTGLSYVASFLCLLWARIKTKGWNRRTKW